MCSCSRTPLKTRAHSGLRSARGLAAAARRGAWQLRRRGAAMKALKKGLGIYTRDRDDDVVKAVSPRARAPQPRAAAR